MFISSWKQILPVRTLFARQLSLLLKPKAKLVTENSLTELNLPELVTNLQSMSSNDARQLFFDGSRRMRILEHAKDQMQTNGDRVQQEALAEIYKGHFNQSDRGRGASFLLSDLTFMLEEQLLEDVDRLVESRMNALVPEMVDQSSKKFIRWLMKLIQAHPATSHRFYRHFMRDQATRADLRFWLAQESTLDQRFDDILATLQVGTTGMVKMEIAKNYWDEMGNGDENKTHTYLFDQLLGELHVTPSYIASHLMTSSLWTGNLSACFALHRHLYYEALGYFGVTEYLAPVRFTHVLAALKRNGVSEEGQQYHQLHIWIDRIHGAAWFNDVVRIVVENNPQAAKGILRGVLARLETSLVHLNAFSSTNDSTNLSSSIL